MSYYTTQFDAWLIEHLKNGAVGFMPSDTIYGLSCVATNEKAVEKVYKLKGRDADKPMIILLADIEQASLAGMEPEDLEPENELWPAPLTIIYPARPETPEYLHRGLNTMSFRIPSDERLRALIKQTGPLVSTSANTQGENTAKNIAEAQEYFGNKLDFYVDMGTLGGQPSTIVKVENGQMKIVRQGAFQIPKKALTGEQ